MVREQHGLRPGGLGLMVARALVDELIHNEKRNEVVFVKYLDAAPDRAEGGTAPSRGSLQRAPRLRHRVAQPRAGPRPIRRVGDPRRQALCARRGALAGGRSPLGAGLSYTPITVTNSLTAPADFMSAARSSSVSVISTTCSTPVAPSFTGTPRNWSFTPYSPCR